MMTTYALHFVDDEHGLAKRIEFNAASPGEALVVAKHEAANRRAELWHEGRKLCTLRRFSEEFWQLLPDTLIVGGREDAAVI